MDPPKGKIVKLIEYYISKQSKYIKNVVKFDENFKFLVLVVLVSILGVTLLSKV